MEVPQSNDASKSMLGTVRSQDLDIVLLEQKLAPEDCPKTNETQNTLIIVASPKEEYKLNAAENEV